MALGTALKRMDGVRAMSDRLPVQAVIRDRTTFINTARPPWEPT